MQFDTHFTFSDRERLQKADFESMTTAEYELAKKLAEELPLPVDPVRRRRHEAATSPRHGGRLDLRATLQRMARQPHTLKPLYTRPREELPSLVVLIDISGSMDRYSRLLLHYVHGLMRRALKVHTLTFGTRLTNITRCLRRATPMSRCAWPTSRCRTGRAARASPRRCTSSTSCGRADCWAPMPRCCW